MYSGGGSASDCALMLSAASVVVYPDVLCSQLSVDQQSVSTVGVSSSEKGSLIAKCDLDEPKTFNFEAGPLTMLPKEMDECILYRGDMVIFNPISLEGKTFTANTKNVGYISNISLPPEEVPLIWGITPTAIGIIVISLTVLLVIFVTCCLHNNSRCRVLVRKILCKKSPECCQGRADRCCIELYVLRDSTNYRCKPCTFLCCCAEGRNEEQNEDIELGDIHAPNAPLQHGTPGSRRPSLSSRMARVSRHGSRASQDISDVE